MEDAPSPPKKSTLSVDRAAFLLLRVKKAFKKKRQQRKDKQTQIANAALTSQHRSSCRKVPPPLLRSRTLPAIIVPGIPVVSLHTDTSTFQLDERIGPKSGSNRWSMLTRNASSHSTTTTPGSSSNSFNVSSIGGSSNNNNNNDNLTSIKSLNLPKDDIAGVYRRKSSGSTPGGAQQQQQQQQYGGYTTDAAAATAASFLMMQTCDDFECHADGSLLLRIPAPHVVAARAYRLAAKKRTSGVTAFSASHYESSSSHSASDAQQTPTATATHDASQNFGVSGSGCGSGCSGSASTASGSASGSGCTGGTAGGSGSGGGTTNTALTKLAKLLHQSTMTTTKLITTAAAAATLSTSMHGGGDYNFPMRAGGGVDDAPRRLSWERRKDSSALQRSASIDSFAEIVWSDTPRPSLDIPRPMVPFSKRPSASSLFSNCSTSSQNNAQLNINDMCSSGSSAGNSRRESLLSPSSTRRNKMTRIINDNILPNSLTHDSATLRSDRTDTSLSDNSVILRKKPTYPYNNNNNNSKNNDALNYHDSAISFNVKRDNCTNFNNNNTKNNTSNTFRWSEQITQNVSVAKIRTAISCNAQDLKEMEFLIPHAPINQSTTTTTSSAAALTATTKSLPKSLISQRNYCNNNGSNSDFKSKTNSFSSSSTSGLSVSRHSRVTPTHTSIITSTNAMTNPKNAKLNEQKNAACSDENNAGNIQQNLAIFRQPLNARAKYGNTPYRNSKMSKKQLKLAQSQLDKLTQINLHLHALFSAVEHGHLDKARTILESTDVDVNSINTDGLSALDVAVLSNNRSMTKMLLQHGALEGSQFSTDNIGSKLNGLLKDAESRIQDLSITSEGGIVGGPSQPTFTSRPSISSIIIGNTGSSVTGCTGNEIDKQIGIWERRVKGLRRMLLGWDQARPPDAPVSVTVDVTGENSITVQILEPYEGAIGTKFKVQWSTRADFSNVVGEREIMEWTSFHGNMGTQCHISGLTQGRRYYIRATCGNVKGWGAFKTSVPGSIIPSSWRDLNNREDRYLGRQRVLDNLFTAVRLARPADVSELTLDTNTAQRRYPKKKTTIKQLFSVASKFQKSLRRGIYLASIIYCEDKVLVTSEDFLPVIEIDETYPSTLHSDYHWLMKVACTWDDVKSLRTDMERNLTSAVHFRTKLLSAVCQMQSALGLTDLGQLYYKALRDSHGTVVLTCIQAVKSQKSVSILNSRWLPVNKLQKKIVALLEDYNISNMLVSSIGEQIHYHHTSMQRLGPGLYLGYLKMQCSVEQIQVVVPAKTPNVLPHYKVRDNSHITAEEWQILKRSSSYKSAESRSNSPLRLPLEFNVNAEATTEVQRLFLYDLTTAAHKLFAYMNIKPEDAATHRLYDVEVIEHSRDISFLIICPSVELTCAVPGQSELLLQRDDLASLSIQSFEMIHLRTYQPGIIQKYARLSCILELDTALANHSHREAFSTSELQIAKERLAKLHELTANLNAVWKSVRWLMDVIAFARDKNAQPSIAMKEILDFGQVNDDMSSSGSTGKQLLQLPTRDAKFTKSSGRGSWPGPAANCQSGSNSCLAGEHSKSEQNLGASAITPISTASLKLVPPQKSHTTTTQQSSQKLLQVGNEYAGSDTSLRKNSGDSMASSQYTTRSYYSAADSALGSNNDLGSSSGGGGGSGNIVFAIPPSRSDDTLALASLHNTQSTAASSHRKRTNANINNAPAPASLLTSHSSSSAPYLARDASGSSLSLKNVYTSSNYNIKGTKSSQDITTAQLSKVKAASSANLRESGGLYLKTTLSALQTEIKGTSLAAAATTNTTDESTVPLHQQHQQQQQQPSKASSSKSLSRQSSEEDSASGSSLASEQTAALSTQQSSASSASTSSASGIIHVYTAYNTGLASGTSLKLHVTPKTTAREVINLVVKQLNMAAVLKGNNGPIYTAEMLDNFCLVAVIGARERCLRDDFKPLQLQNPWKKGRLYVRQKHELLAAIEHSNRKSHLI